MNKITIQFHYLGSALIGEDSPFEVIKMKSLKITIKLRTEKVSILMMANRKAKCRLKITEKMAFSGVKQGQILDDSTCLYYINTVTPQIFP